MSYLIDKIHELHVHKFNPIVAKGVAVSQMEYALEYVDRALQLSAKTFPPKLKYLGYTKCSVRDEFNMLTAKKTAQHNLELAPSDIYLVNLNFEWDGVPLPPKPIFFPYLGKGGRFNLRGKKFTVFPVLADETISVSKEDIFVPFLSAKVTFKRMQYLFRIDGVQRIEYLVYSKIHNHDPSKQPRRSTRANTTVKAHATMAHYLFCKWGVHETFKRFYDAEVVITEKEVDTNLYPPDEWAVCSSTQTRPRSVRLRQYVPTNIKVLIRRDKLNNGTLGLLSGLFYVLDHYPDRFSEEVLDGTHDEVRRWMVVLGHVIYRNKDSEGDLYLKIVDHLESLDQYVDDMTREGLEREGYLVSDLYELMALLIFDFTEILMKTDPSSMYGKVLAVNRYVLADIIKAISIFRFKIVSIKNRELTHGDVSKYLSKYLKPDVIYNNMSSKHNEISTVQCAGDNMMFNYTSGLILQENATGTTKRKAVTSFKDPSKYLHPSILVGGSILALPKSEPTGRTVLNPYLALDLTYKIKCPENLKPKLDYIAQCIKRI